MSLHLLPTRPATARLGCVSQTRHFDGVLCFGGEDWWYHNRGHFDMQMMQQFGRHVPVIYVNSLGMRVPTPGKGRAFMRRVSRKLHSMRRGQVSVNDRFTVVSPVAIPSSIGLRLTKRMLTRSLKATLRQQGISNPLLWVACPTAAAVVDDFKSAGMVYQRTDRYECFQGVDRRRIEQYDTFLKSRADLTVFCSTALFQEESESCYRATHVDHGVDLQVFGAAGDDATEPNDVASLPRPRIGYVGGIDAHTFDPGLFADIARTLPEMHFVLVGDCSLAPGWCDLPNVTMVGRQSYDQVPHYMAACDVLIMPWNTSKWIDACNPVKLKEYLAVGRPVVSTPFPELNQYEGLVRQAGDADGFARAITMAISSPHDVTPGRDRVRDHTWSEKASTVLTTLAEIGVEPRLRPSLAVRSNPALETTSDASKPDGLLENGQGNLRFPVLVGSNPDRGLDLAAGILLAGGLRPSELVASERCSVLDLPVGPGRSLLNHWEEVLSELGTHLPIRVVHDGCQPAPWPLEDRAHMRVERDPRALRGPAGVLHDLCRDYHSDEFVLVAEGSRYVTTGLRSVLDRHVACEADITVVINPDASTAGLYVIRCASLEIVPPIGYVDLKEQWLPQAIAAGFDVRVHEIDHHGILPLRTPDHLKVVAQVASERAHIPVDQQPERIHSGRGIPHQTIDTHARDSQDPGVPIQLDVSLPVAA